MFNFITQHRRGTTEEWDESTIVPKNGELVLEECSDGITRIKIGNGSSTFNDLLYIDQKLADEILSAHKRISELVKDTSLDTNNIGTELRDIRHSYDNLDYDCAGDAVRAIGADVYDLRNSLTQFINADAVDGLYYENNMLYLTANGEVLEETGVQVISGTGGGGGGSASVLKIGYITTSPVIITPSDSAILRFTFSGVDSSGDPVMQASSTWKVDGKTVEYGIVKDGENSFDVTKYLNVGTSKVFLSVKDDAGNIVNKTWSVQKVDVKLESTFNDKITYPIGEVLFDCVPYGAVDKTLHILIDGEELPTVDYSAKISGTTVRYELPVQTHGAHLVESYITAKINETDIESNHILKDILWYDSSSNIPVIGTSQQKFTAKQYDTTNITYTVFDPSTETPQVIIYVDDNEVSRGVLEESTNVYSFNTNIIGNHTIKIKCGVTEKIITANIESLGVEIEPVTAGLAFDFNPVGKHNSDVDRLWNWKNTVHMTVSDNFDWINGGYKEDADGIPYFCIKSGTTATIDYKLFGDDAKKNGKEVKVIFKTTNVSNADSTFLSCLDNTTETDHIGLDMRVHKANIYGQSGNLELAYSEDDVIEFEFNISKNTETVPMVMGYEDGVSTRPLVYTAAYNFKQNTAKDITIGCPDCDVHIYRMKAYNTSLTSIDILNNFIADASTSAEMINRYNRNQIYDENQQLTPDVLAEKCPWLRVYKLSAPYFTNNKSDKVKNTTIQQIYKGGDAVLDNWTAYKAQHSGQGTSSNNYGAAGRNLDFIMNKDGCYIELGDGSITDKITLSRTSVPVAYLNAKVNIASSNNLTNAILANRYNQFNPYHRPFVRDESVDTSFIKDTMEFYNCVIFIQETDPDMSKHREFADTDWHFYAIGNIGDSKKTDNTRATDPDDKYECCVEIMDVSLPLSDFPKDTMMSAMETVKDETTGEVTYVWVKDENLGILYEKFGDEYRLTEDTTVDYTKTYYVDILEHDDFSEDYTYGWRYLWEDGTNEENQEVFDYCKQKWIDFYRFVTTSSDAEFKSRFSEYFVKESALYYYLFTTRYCMVDNRAKNTFWHYGKTGEVDADGNPIRKWDLCWDYDNDTSLGLNNFGKQIYDYGLEDMDKDANGIEVFRESDSTFFCRVRDLFAEDLKNLYNGVTGDGTNFDTVWNAESFIKECDDWQNQFPEELWRIDTERKYIRTYTSSFIDGEGNAQFLVDMCNGKMKYHRRQWERSQARYIASKYQTSSAVKNGAVFRCNIPGGDLVVEPNLKLKLTPFSRMYLNVQYSSSIVRVRATEANKVYEIPFEGKETDIINVYNSSEIQNFGDLSTCYLETADTSKAIRIKQLVLGNSTEGYRNDGFQGLTTGANVLLEELNIENVTGLKGSLDLQQLTNLVKIYAKGCNINSLVFAEGGKIALIEAPALNSLIFKNLMYLATENITLENYNNVVDLCVDSCPLLDALELLNRCPNVNRVRLIDVDFGEFTYEDFSTKFFHLKGLNNELGETPNAWLTGTVKFDTLTGSQYNQLRTRYPNLNVQFNELTCNITFMDTDLVTVLRTQTVTGFDNNLSDVLDPVELGLIAKPVKEQTESHVFEWSGWSNKTDYETLEESILEDVSDDLILYPTFNSSLRKYTVYFYNNDNSFISSYQVDWGTAEFVYPVDLPERAGTGTPEAYRFKTWSPEPKNIKSDLYCYAVYELKPESIYELTIDDFDYAIEDNSSELTIVNYIGTAKIIKIADTYTIDGKTYTVTGIIGHDVDPYDNIVTEGFNNKGIEYVELPETLKVIGARAFYNNPWLSSIIIPASVKEIWYQAFGNCRGLTEVYYNAVSAEYKRSSNTSYGPPFYNSISTHGFTLYIGKVVEKVPSGMFNSGIRSTNPVLYGARKVIFDPSSKCSTIESNAFYMSNMEEVEFSSSITSIGSQAFSECLLVDVVLPSNLQSLSGSVFDNDATIKSMYLPASLTSIGDATFRGCINIEFTIQRGSCFKWINNCLINTATKKLIFGVRDVTIPDNEGITDITDHSLTGVTSTSIVIPEGVTRIGQYSFYQCLNLVELVLPKTLTKLDNFAICYNWKLNELILPNNLQYIGSYAVARLGIQSLIVPPSVSYIGNYSFKECKSLTYAELNCTNATYGVADNDTLKLFDASPVEVIKVDWASDDTANNHIKVNAAAPWGSTAEKVTVKYTDKDVEYNIV